MRILLVAATEGEISALKPDLKPDVDVLVTGIGMVATAAPLAFSQVSDLFVGQLPADMG